MKLFVVGRWWWVEKPENAHREPAGTTNHLPPATGSTKKE
jgi:hypothetical protein